MRIKSLGHLAGSIQSCPWPRPGMFLLSGAMRRPNPDSVSWKKRRHSLSSEEQTTEALYSKTTENVSTAAVSTQRQNANQVAAKVMQLRMKGRHKEAEQLSASFASSTSDQVHLKRKEDTDLHLAGKIIHDRQYDLSSSIDDEYDSCDSSKRCKRKNKEADVKDKSTRGYLLSQKEHCLYCIENDPTRPKHLVVAVGNFSYLMLPRFKPLVPGHCVVLPLQHESATRTVDQGVWEEIRNFKKCLLKMFAQDHKDVIFMETAISLTGQWRHCMLECVPVPCQISSTAPMYFKKAIDEAEEEWSQHEMKKLLKTTACRDLRRVVPENFAYFHVEFGLDHGFVHVIDDESKFSGGFGLNVIRGMLGLTEDMHRRRGQESVDKQKQAVARFVENWKPFDWTKKLG